MELSNYLMISVFFSRQQSLSLSELDLVLRCPMELLLRGLPSLTVVLFRQIGLFVLFLQTGLYTVIVLLILLLLLLSILKKLRWHTAIRLFLVYIHRDFRYIL